MPPGGSEPQGSSPEGRGESITIPSDCSGQVSLCPAQSCCRDLHPGPCPALAAVSASRCSKMLASNFPGAFSREV